MMTLAAAGTLCLALVSQALVVPLSRQPFKRSGTCVRMAAEDFDADMLLLETEERMEKSVNALKNNLGTLREFRAASLAFPSAVFFFKSDAPDPQARAARRRTSCRASWSTTTAPRRL